MSAQKIDRYFLVLGLLLALVGMTFGIVMGVREDFTLAPVHAHINLVGFVALTLFGVGYRIGWAGKDGWAVVHFIVAAAGAVLFPLGIYFAEVDRQPGLAIFGSLLTLASLLLFLINCLRGWHEGTA